MPRRTKKGRACGAPPGVAIETARLTQGGTEGDHDSTTTRDLPLPAGTYVELRHSRQEGRRGSRWSSSESDRRLCPQPGAMLVGVALALGGPGRCQGKRQRVGRPGSVVDFHRTRVIKRLQLPMRCRLPTQRHATQPACITDALALVVGPYSGAAAQAEFLYRGQVLVAHLTTQTERQ